MTKGIADMFSCSVVLPMEHRHQNGDNFLHAKERIWAGWMLLIVHFGETWAK
uniref:Uncharacterized protein n=1 Tax=Rhizophora mucronata TaxID=61149 RepID=A0A2P2NNZ7_RHIMU